MIIDKNLEFSDSQAVIASAISTNVYDTGATPTLKDIGAVRPLYLVIQVDTTVTQAGAGTNTITFESDSTENLATSATVHWSSGAIPKATLVAGYTRVIPLPWEVLYERYMGVRYTTSENNTAGAYSAFITDSPALYHAYPDAIAANDA
jgi:hypothetical protein